MWGLVKWIIVIVIVRGDVVNYDDGLVVMERIIIEIWEVFRIYSW